VRRDRGIRASGLRRGGDPQERRSVHTGALPRRRSPRPWTRPSTRGGWRERPAHGRQRARGGARPSSSVLRIRAQRAGIIVLIAAIVCGGVSGLVARSKPKEYIRHLGAAVPPEPAEQRGARHAGAQHVDRPAARFGHQPGPRQVARGVHGGGEGAEARHRSRQACSTRSRSSRPKNSDIIKITSQDADPKRAARIANGFASGYVNYAQQQDQQRISQGEQLLRARLAALPSGSSEIPPLQAALQKLIALGRYRTVTHRSPIAPSVPSSPSSPRPLRDTVLGVPLRPRPRRSGSRSSSYALDRRVKTPEEFERLYGLRSLVNIPQASFRARNAPDSRPGLRSPIGSCARASPSRRWTGTSELLVVTQLRAR